MLSVLPSKQKTKGRRKLLEVMDKIMAYVWRWLNRCTLIFKLMMVNTLSMHSFLYGKKGKEGGTEREGQREGGRKRNP